MRSSGIARLGSPDGISPVIGTPLRRQPEQRRANDGQRHDEQRDRPARQPFLAEQQQHDRDRADRKNEKLHLSELPDQHIDPLEEIVSATRHAEQTRKLRHGDGEAGADLEADQDRVADQQRDHAQAQKPGQDAQARRR